MGELLICREEIAALPFYIEGISWNVYSLEELCYYIENNTFLLEKDFMTEELCTWIEKEVKNAKLAERLRDIMRMDGRLSEFVLEILTDCGYCPRESMKEIVRILRDLEEKSDFECNKIRADRLMEKEKYLSSIYEYKNLLDSNEAGEQSKELLGAIWHNLGTAYARLFLFGEAKACFEKAYRLNGHMESLKEYMMVMYCIRDEQGIKEGIEKYNIGDDVLKGIRHEMAHAYHGEALEQKIRKIESTFAMNEKGSKTEYQKALSNMMLHWKEEYRRISRI